MAKTQGKGTWLYSHHRKQHKIINGFMLMINECLNFVILTTLVSNIIIALINNYLLPGIKSYFIHRD